MKYAMIDKFRHQHPVARLCALVDVAKSGYQAWCTGKVTSPRKLEDVRLVVAIKAAHQRGRGIYGPEKIRSELLAQGIWRPQSHQAPAQVARHPLYAQEEV